MSRTLKNSVTAVFTTNVHACERIIASRMTGRMTEIIVVNKTYKLKRIHFGD